MTEQPKARILASSFAEIAIRDSRRTCLNTTRTCNKLLMVNWLTGRWW